MAVLKAKGTLLKMDISSTMTTIAQVTGIRGPGATAGMIDTTKLTSDWMGKLAEIPDGGQVTFSLLFDKDLATHQAITDIFAGAATDFEIHWNGSATNKWDFSAIVAGFSPTGETNDAIRADVTLEVTTITFPT